MAIATLDLSSVTDALIDALTHAVTASPLWKPTGPTVKFAITVTGMPADLAREEGDTQISLSLLHVAPDPAYRNRTARGPDGIVVPNAPVALTLTYALAAFGAKDYVHEQQAMSIALAWATGNPIQRLAVAASPGHQIECTLTLEPASLDEIARLWQSLAGPLRLTALLRVGVVFLGREPAALVPRTPPTRLGMLAAADLPAGGPMLLAITEPVLVGDPRAPTALRPGHTALVAGLALDGPEKLFLSPADDSASIDVTAWASQRTANTLHLKLPGAPGAPPGGAPPAGRYRLRIGAVPLTGPALALEIGA